MNMKSLVTVVLTLGLVGGLAGSAGAVQQYHYVDLGVLPGYQYSFAYGINNLGQVVGKSSTDDSGTHAVLWSNGGIQDLGILPGGNNYSEARAINNLGQIVGRAILPGNIVQAFLWQNGTMLPLVALPGKACTYAYDINDNGQVVGYSSATGGSYPLPCVWQDIGTVEALPTLAPGESGSANNINNSGQIVGATWVTVPTAVLWLTGVPQDLGNLGGSQSTARGINDSGQIVGDSHVNPDQWHGFLWENGTMQDLGNGTGALAINNLGQIINGSSIWDNGTWYNLNDLTLDRGSISLNTVYAINDLGEIVGVGSNNHAFRLDPVPLPGSLLLLGSGLVGLVGWRRYRKD